MADFEKYDRREPPPHDASAVMENMLVAIDSVMSDMQYIYDRTTDSGSVTLPGSFFRDIYSAMQKLRIAVRVAYEQGEQR